MTPAEAGALSKVRDLAWAGRIRVTGHAAQRLDERCATFDDVREAIMTATDCRTEPGDRWKLAGGRDCDGDGLTVIVSIEQDVVVVTLF
jgi:hypothetical protein